MAEQITAVVKKAYPWTPTTCNKNWTQDYGREIIFVNSVLQVLLCFQLVSSLHELYRDCHCG